MWREESSGEEGPDATAASSWSICAKGGVEEGGQFEAYLCLYLLLSLAH